MDVIHSFYQQYLGKPSEFDEMAFINTSGDHLKLEAPKLEAYLARLKNTNYLSESYLKQLKTYYFKCEKSWQEESKDEPSSCLDADIFTCSQDSPELIYDYFTKTSVETTYLTAERIFAQMEENGWRNDFELQLENNKWKLVKLRCDLSLGS
ncbi:MAG: hypothetical protein AAF688_15365 [Bacteroidota bacterium]